ncbi:L-fucose dehydrogenase-like isoform X2 [Branchiostoma floridae x Branchiostoma japonicum]
MAEGGLRYKDKVVIVTGGSKGIGEGAVRAFEEAGKKLESEMNTSGPGEALFIPCDVTKEEDIRNVIDKTVEKYGRIDCLINNAGMHPPEQTIDDTSVDEFRSLLNLNLVSYFIASKFALPHLRKTQGNIINMSSLVGIIGQTNACAYVTTKGGITSLTRALAVDEAKYGVRVNTVSPGNIWTPMWDGLSKASGNPEAMVKGGEEAQLLGRMGTIEEAGKVCLFLAAEATFSTGTDMLLSGGAELNYGRKTRLVEKTNIYE